MKQPAFSDEAVGVEAKAALRGSMIKGVVSAAVAVLMIAAFQTASAATLPPDSFADLAAKVTPAVVNISSTEQMAGGSEQFAMPFAFPPGSPFEQFFKQFRNFRQGGKVMALGSGFIIDPSGYIVTNDHVIDNATKIQVTLSDGKTLPAKLIGADKKTDLALLKINSPRPLPFVSFGDSSAARVGDWVLAVGNPFGLGGTVTTGIISARGRDLHNGPYEDFLQIDASINKGNSGGPTFDLAGDVIGINTAIASPNGGSVGIGFAIPSNAAKPIIAELRKSGHIERGWIGVEIQQVTPTLASSLGLGDSEGALVASVQPGGPAAEAGIEQGDVILTFDDKAVGQTRELPRIVAETPPGKQVEVVVWRAEKRKTLSLTVALMKETETASATNGNGGDQSPTNTSDATLGVQLSPLTPGLRQQLGLADSVTGVVVTDVNSDGPAAQQGLRAGDVIEQVSRQRVTTPKEVAGLVQNAVKALKPAVLLLVNRRGNQIFLAVKVGKA